MSRLRAGLLEEPDASPELAEVLRLCRGARARTDGAFDVLLPDATGTRRPDPSGLVKGWALARAGRRLAAALEGLPGARGYVSGGGDVVAVGGRGRGGGPGPCRPAPGAGRSGWVVGVQDPADPAAVLARLRLDRGGVATSGTYARGAHLVDPRTGSPVPGPVAATVVGPDVLRADVLATAVAVRGASGRADDVAAALALADRDGCDALLVTAAGTATTAGWPGRLVEAPALVSF